MHTDKDINRFAFGDRNREQAYPSVYLTVLPPQAVRINLCLSVQIRVQKNKIEI